MSYEQAMEAAGATVLRFEQFGSYQGDWFALVEYDGKTGWVHGCYGSCSGCDAFESEFGWSDHERSDYQERLADFGTSYLEGLMTQEEALAEASRYIEWDSDAAEMVAFLKAHAEEANP
ncbi:hypothetical protein [Stenotrophomonas geniculata]|uniref:hypothetical protein n=1 Tax=Stenotrophomonas geniculata TaxID=86188 RepID=UPI002E76E906|nr:hypothetical protein [Stenotrophomonas geniculata]